MKVFDLYVKEFSVVFSVHPIPGTTFPFPTQKTHPMYPGCSFSVSSVHFVYPVPGTAGLSALSHRQRRQFGSIFLIAYLLAFLKHKQSINLNTKKGKKGALENS
jgi:hypothetical protein